MITLIVSSLTDGHAHAVMRELAKHRGRVELLDLSEFPTRLALSMAFCDGSRLFQIDRPGYGRLDLGDVRAVWWRRPQAFQLPESVVDPSHRRLALSEASTAFAGLYQSMKASWINAPLRDSAAAHKPWQLAVAQETGLDIPDTLITSDPEAARAFWTACDGDVIYKQFAALPDAWRETRRVGPQEIASAEHIRLTPVIFQRRVAAVADVRVTIIGEDVFAASVGVDELTYDVDVRLNLAVRWVRHVLPETMVRLLLALMRRLDLVYGAIDLRLTQEGRYIFLEINPGGQFLFIEEATGQPITAAMAAHLTAA